MRMSAVLLEQTYHIFGCCRQTCTGLLLVYDSTDCVSGLCVRPRPERATYYKTEQEQATENLVCHVLLLVKGHIAVLGEFCNGWC